MRSLDSSSDNRKSKIENLKWVGCLALLVMLTGWVRMAEAQQPKKVHPIGYLTQLSPSTESARSEGIRLALRQHNYIEGQNIAIEFRYAEGKYDQLPELAAELVRRKVEVILVAGEQAVRAAMNATKTIPIVLLGAGFDPVDAGHVESLARPGGNVTGITSISRDLNGKRLELLKEAIGKLTRVAVLYDPAILPSVLAVKEDIPVFARALKLTVQPWEVKDVDGLAQVIAALNKKRSEGLYVLAGGPPMRANQKRIVDFALKSQLPSMYGSQRGKEAVDAGGLMYYGVDIADSYRQVAWYVDRILAGTKPEALPVQQPMKFEFVINLQTAKKIGVTINTDVLARATKIIR
jgi:putative ABC transport system substrate-binding protein